MESEEKGNKLEKDNIEATQRIDAVKPENNIEATQRIDAVKPENNIEATQRVDAVKPENNIEATQRIDAVKPENNIEATQIVDAVKPESDIEKMASARTENYMESKEAERQRREKDEKLYNLVGEKKKKSIKKYIAFVLIFAVVAISITACLIYSKNLENSNSNPLSGFINSNKNAKNQIKDSVEPSLIGSKYDENDLKIEHITKAKQEINNCEVFCNYELISDGLKDESIKNKINSEIENKINNVDIEKYSREYDNFSISAIITANYSNALSVEFSTWAYNDDGSGLEYIDFEGLNYKLEDGSKIKFDELFVESADMKNIINKSAYKSLIEGKYYQTYSEDLYMNMDNVDYSEIEDEVFEIVSDYNSRKMSQDIKFSFDTRYITLYLANQRITIDMSEFDDKIAIYNRFKTAKNLYKTNSIGAKGVYTYTKRYISQDGYDYNKEKYDKVWVNIGIDVEYDFWSLEKHKMTPLSDEKRGELDRAFIETKKFIESKIDEYKNTKKPVYLSFYSYINYDSYKNMPNVVVYFQEATMSIDFYENKMDKVFAQAFIDASDSPDALGLFMLPQYLIKDSECNIEEMIIFETEEILPESFFEELPDENEILNEIENSMVQNELNNNVINEIITEDIDENEVEEEILNEIENTIENEIIENVTENITENLVIENETSI